MTLRLDIVGPLDPVAEMSSLKRLRIDGTKHSFDTLPLTRNSSLNQVVFRECVHGIRFRPFGRDGVPIRRVVLDRCGGELTVMRAGELGSVRELSIIRATGFANLTWLERAVEPG